METAEMETGKETTAKKKTRSILMIIYRMVGKVTGHGQ